MKKLRIDILTRLDARAVPQNSQEIRLFCKLRNELARMPYFLEYYRKLGIDRFIFTDNGSTDGTTDYLLQQPDCHVLYTTDSFRDVYVYWQNRALDLYGVDHWCLIVDADELLVYPHSEKVNIKHFCQILEQDGSDGLYTFMLDMYADGDMAKAICEPGKPLTDICPMFDRDYQFVRRTFLDLLQFPNRPPPFPITEVVGGPRARLFYPEQNSTKVWPRVRPRLLGRVLKLLARLGLVSDENVPHMASILFKIPLVKWRKGLSYASSTHIITPLKLSSVTGILLHFKFFSDFHEKAVREAARVAAAHGARGAARAGPCAIAQRRRRRTVQGTAHPLR